MAREDHVVLMALPTDPTVLALVRWQAVEAINIMFDGVHDLPVCTIKGAVGPCLYPVAHVYYSTVSGQAQSQIR